jgi:hypothetical protein
MGETRAGPHWKIQRSLSLSRLAGYRVMETSLFLAVFQQHAASGQPCCATPLACCTSTYREDAC